MHNSSAEANGLVNKSDVFEKHAGQWRLVSNVVLQVPKWAYFNIADKQLS
jgi:hypothetical protein